jgi:hypothetical protein
VEGWPAGFANISMTPTGFETDGVSAEVDTHLHHLASRGAAQSGADAAGSPTIDPDLARLIATWSNLPEHVRRAIVTLADGCA